MKHVKRVSKYLGESEMSRRQKPGGRAEQVRKDRWKYVEPGDVTCGGREESLCGDGKPCRDLQGCDARRGEDVTCGADECRQAAPEVLEKTLNEKRKNNLADGLENNLENDLEDDLKKFAVHLRYEGRKDSTIKKYLRDVKAFRMWLGDEDVTREKAREWRDFLCKKEYASVTVNSMLVSLNLFFRFCGREECCVKGLRLQHRFFRNSERELAKNEYERLVETAQQQGKERLALLIETICATGVRVSEVKAFTVESVRRGRADISLKGKIRTILMPERLRKKLLEYIRKKKIVSGEVFVTRTGKGLTRQQIWAEMKRLCSEAGILETKVFPHNLRHLFARTFYRVSRDIAKLADVLGHSHIGTTRLYLTSTGAEHARHLGRLNLVSRK